MKLEIGMYVRYKYVNCIYIGKIKFISEVMGFDETLAFIIDNYMEEILKKDIIGEPSFNIVDLIEVGDIISYEFPTGLGMINYENVTVSPELLDVLQNGENNHEYIIKSIVTKQQFESIQYKVVK